MRVLITGTAGFIARHLSEHFYGLGDEVAGINRHVGDDFQGDLRDMPFCERVLNRFQPEAVFHLAAQALVPDARRDPWGTFEDNVRGTYNLLEAVARYSPDAAVVVASSDKAYGEAPIGRGYQEDDPVEGRGAYDCSKACADLIAHSYALERRMRVAVVRAGNVYGPGDDHPSRVIPSLIKDLIAGRRPTIHSDGTPVRDYLFVDDAVEGYAAVMRYLVDLDGDAVFGGSFYTAFNLAGGEPVSVLELCELLREVSAEVLGEPGGHPVVLAERMGEIAYQELNTDLARLVLDWTPRFSLRRGLRRTFQHHVRWAKTAASPGRGH